MQEFMVFMQQHLTLSLGLLAVFIALVVLELIRSKKSSWELTPGQVTQLINHQNAVVIDVRNQDVFSKGHIIGAVSMPAQELKEPAKKLEKHKSKPIVLVCGTGMESRKIAMLLNKDAYQAYALAGGIRAWMEADMPLVKS